MLVVSLAVLFLAALGIEVLRNRKIRFRSLSLPPQSVRRPCGEAAYRILHISDIHLCSTTLERLKPLESLRDTVWDFILITGDVIEDDSGIEPAAQALGNLRSRYGKYAVLGNHDYLCYKAQNIRQWFRILLGVALEGRCEDFCRKNDVSRLVAALEENGVLCLFNQMLQGLTGEGDSFQIFGIDDPSTGRDEPQALYDALEEDQSLRLVLMHSPHRISGVKPLRPDLIFCGHTHGGQVRIPGFGALITCSDAGRKNASGMVRMEGCRVHISPGMGVGLNLPFRLFAPPELTEIFMEKRPSAVLA